MSQTESSYDFGEAESIESAYKLRNNISIHHDTFSQGPSLEVQPPVSTLRQTFQQLDRDKKGFIRKSVLKQTIMFTSQQYDSEILKNEINECQDNIKYSRFVEIFERANIGDSINKWLFTLYDKQKKGYIDDFDLRRVGDITGVELTQEEIMGMLATQRNLNNGKVDFEDFKYIMEENLLFL